MVNCPFHHQHFHLFVSYLLGIETNMIVSGEEVVSAFAH